jgi:hypothetical protein
MTAEEAHVARLLCSDSRELLELLRPLREDVQLLRESSPLSGMLNDSNRDNKSMLTNA